MPRQIGRLPPPRHHTGTIMQPQTSTANVTVTTPSTLADVQTNLGTLLNAMQGTGLMADMKNNLAQRGAILTAIAEQAPVITEGSETTPEVREDPVYSWVCRAVLSDLRKRLHRVREAVEEKANARGLHAKVDNVISVVAAAIKRGEAGPPAPKADNGKAKPGKQ